MKTLLAIIGMPGAGKGTITRYLVEKLKVPKVRFGDVTDDELARRGLETNEINERYIRESLREELGMAAYAVKSLPKIEANFHSSDIVIADGLYSWEEYLLLKKEFNLILIHVFAPPLVRYKRLISRKVRQLKQEDVVERDHAEITNLNKGGPIALADFVVDNSRSIRSTFRQVDHILKELKLTS